MKVLVTGGAGFIGSNLAMELEKQRHEIVVVDNLFSGIKENLRGFKGKFIELDVSDRKIIDLEDKFDAIFHQAAITDPRYGNDEETFKKNVEGFRNIVELAKRDNAKLVYASTANLYGNGPIPMREDQEKEIITVYGKSKIEMDKIAEKLFGSMHIVGLRYFNVYGPRETHKGRPASMVYHLWKQMTVGKRPRLFKYGEQKRDQIYVKDVVTANILALDAPSGVYNIGTGSTVTFDHIVEVLNRVLGTNLQPDYFDMPYDKKTYQVNTQADTTKAQKYLSKKVLLIMISI